MNEPAREPQPRREPERNPEWYDANPHARISSTRLATFRRCPAWYRYQYLDWHRTWTLPVMRAGHASQAALERVFDSRPKDHVTLDELEHRAKERAFQVLEELWNTEAELHDADPGSLGMFELPRARYESYVAQGIRFHMHEVRARLSNRHPRTEAPLSLPAVSNPAAAWVAVRPWHPVKTSEEDLALDKIPRGYFQGQYDLVYTWTGGRRIVDLKSSKGTSLFGTEIAGQLLSYAWMEREFGRQIEGLEGWFLGQPAPHLFEVPGEASLDRFGEEVLDLIDRSGSERGFDAWRPADFEPAPASPGSSFAPLSGEPSAWCAVCPAALVCPKSTRKAPPPGEGLHFDDPSANGRSVEGLVLGVSEPRVKNGKARRRVTIANTSGAMTFGFEASDVARMAPQGLRAGHVVRITGLSPWRPPSGGRTLFFSNSSTKLDLLATSYGDLSFDPER